MSKKEKPTPDANQTTPQRRGMTAAKVLETVLVYKENALPLLLANPPGVGPFRRAWRALREEPQHIATLTAFAEKVGYPTSWRGRGGSGGVGRSSVSLWTAGSTRRFSVQSLKNRPFIALPVAALGAKRGDQIDVLFDGSLYHCEAVLAESAAAPTAAAAE